MFKVKNLLFVLLTGYLVLGYSLCLHASNVKKKYAKDGRLLWEFNESDFEFIIYKYKPLGREWKVDSAQICKDLNHDMRLEKEKDVCHRLVKFQMGGDYSTTKGKRPQLLYISGDPSIIEVLKKRIWE